MSSIVSDIAPVCPIYAENCMLKSVPDTLLQCRIRTGIGDQAPIRRYPYNARRGYSMKKVLSGALFATLVSSPAAFSADEVKIGFITTLTTGAASIGKDQENAVNLALEHIGNTMGGKPVKLVMADDGFKPEVGKQATDKLVKQDDVDFVAGYIWSHVLLASRKSVLDAGKFLISANAGPSPVAGKLCHENFFSTSWQNDQTPMAMGETLNKRGVK